MKKHLIIKIDKDQAFYLASKYEFISKELNNFWKIIKHKYSDEVFNEIYDETMKKYYDSVIRECSK